LTGCGEDADEADKMLRSIRTITVAEPASGKMRRYSGAVEAAVNSSISFEVSGNVQKVNVEVGERTKEGQVLAELDEQTHKLNVSAAQAPWVVPRCRWQIKDKKDKRLFARLQSLLAPFGASRRSSI
jgi:multidrug efflux pump subunit AcrA (membrane-fusion protein)